MKILILGSVGFIGTNLCNYLYDYFYDIEGVDNFSFSYEDSILYKTHNQCISTLTSDFLNQFDVMVSSFCSNIIYAEEFPIETFINNSINAITCFSKFNGKIIYLSTSSVYGNPILLPSSELHSPKLRNAYDTSKLITETYLKTRGNYTTLRLSNVYGPYQRPESKYCGIIGKIIYNKLIGEKIKIFGNGTDTRDFTYVDDVVKAIEKCIELPPQNTEINIGTGIETSILDLCKIIEMDNQYEFMEPRGIDGICKRCLYTKKAKKLLDWEPKATLTIGLKLTELWIKKNYNL